ncbi:MAG TPA: suppressor of fused domain protein [Alphaproteobacteria bacterium]|nr:suppressor of fused domain protein [Alphaproteobacteria bacterium]
MIKMYSKNIANKLIPIILLTTVPSIIYADAIKSNGANKSMLLKNKDDLNYNEYLELVCNHVEKYIGPIAKIFTDNSNEKYPLSILIVKPNSKRDYYTILTCGRANIAKEEHKTAPFTLCEFMICLPSNWRVPMTDEEMEKVRDQDIMPVELLMKLARYPHEIFIGHSIPASFLNFKNVLIHVPLIPNLNGDFKLLDAHENAIFFFGIYPIYEEEFNYKKSLDGKVDHPSDELLYKLESNGVSLILDPNRKNVSK